ncbi:hypothetical protein [Actinomadura madurae]|uniref:hypothetical protein n=1 Tax=Actinomadura madurae TaxID=1993 RepID=UPI0020264D9A|nr:hypothetical protein [Actinomadura madurae]MCP9950737.1 hypothetical protein [Actinomadura madurae]MCP9979965.1 hypothetical protein [Actinomadura madurae]MCQ0008502.1 hypothetical protein [Actinomadura madurae]MCQ0016180.1 hypothetical protein [Actinomadura madurae]URN06976.1 hypothetical protein LUW74_29075 [Actinomadura madurae]
MPAAAVLADDPARLGDALFLAIGPAVIFVTLIAWILGVLMTSREARRRRPR